jgi:hypothetical protein
VRKRRKSGTREEEEEEEEELTDVGQAPFEVVAKSLVQIPHQVDAVPYCMHG